ncbi:MAG: DUF4160 domain-containing protein [Verrucomicrobiota bacterium]|nr:DUF4160 domain-containing protein [Verrucomicrobiota bacterium]
MPEISRFLGIVIKMFFDDHNPPHFHAAYGDFAAAIDIASLKILEGELPPRIKGLVVEWASLHQKDLLTNWDSLRKTQRYKKIDPLV